MGDQVITESGVPTMNVDNKLSNKSLLFGLIAENAQTNRLFVILNRIIKAQRADAMIIPMNIRPDDFYFTVFNLKKSHVNGAYIGQEYSEEVLDVLDIKSTLVTKSTGCDFVLREGDQLSGHYHLPECVASFCRRKSFYKIAIVGANALSRALALTLNKQDVHFYHPEIESIMKNAQTLEMDLDINRIDETLNVDLSGYDLVINTMDETLFAQTHFSPNFLELGEDASYQVATKAICEQNGVQNYYGFEDLLEEIAQTIFNNYIKV